MQYGDARNYPECNNPNPAFSGDTTIAESRKDANIRAGQSTSHTPRIAPPQPAGSPHTHKAIPKSASTGNMPAGKQQIAQAHKVHQRNGRHHCQTRDQVHQAKAPADCGVKASPSPERKWIAERCSHRIQLDRRIRPRHRRFRFGRIRNMRRNGFRRRLGGVFFQDRRQFRSIVFYLSKGGTSGFSPAPFRPSSCDCLSTGGIVLKQ